MRRTEFPAEWIDRLIAIRSETHRSNLEVVEFLKPLLAQAGLKVVEQRVQEGSETFANLIAYNHRPDHPDLLLFNTHLDTVTGGDPRLWTKTGGDPWKATRTGNRIYGLGTADVKIDFLCKLWALGQSKPERPVVLVGTYGEERGLVGVQKLFAERRVTPKYAVVGEPSDLELIYAHKGHVIATASLPFDPGTGVAKSWKGKAAHSSTPHLGVNALSKAFAEIRRRRGGIARLEGGTDSNRVPESAQAQVLDRAGAVTADWWKFLDGVEKLAAQLAKKKDRRFTPSATTLSWNLCRVKGDRAELTFDFRTVPDVDPQKVKESLLPLLPACGKWGDITVDLPLAGAQDNTLMRAASRALKACGVRPVKKTKASSTEAAVYHHHGAQAIVFGPGISVGNVHKPNEHNLVGQIRTATRFYQELVSQKWEGI